MKLDCRNRKEFILSSSLPHLTPVVAHNGVVSLSEGGLLGFSTGVGLWFLSSNFQKVLNRVLLISDDVFSTCVHDMHARASASACVLKRHRGSRDTHVSLLRTGCRFQAPHAGGLLNGRFTLAYRYCTGSQSFMRGEGSCRSGFQRGAGLRWVVRSRSDGCYQRHPYDRHA